MSKGQRAVYALLMVLAWSSLLAFLGWWIGGDHVPVNFGGSAHVIDYALFAALTIVLCHRLFMDAFSWVIAWGIKPEPPVPSAPAGLKVAFITTFVPSSEPLSMLLKTLPAMLRADYPHDVWLLDEGDDDDVKLLCRELGVHYFSRRPVNRYNQFGGRYAGRTKGGNHNAWYDAHGRHYDVVAQIDTDFIPRRDFLTRTLGYFRDEDVAFVGTPQVYGNEEQSVVARGAAQQLYQFYGAIMRGLAGRRMNTMIGANHIVRVAALKDIGFYAGHLTEDLITGMRLHASGWASAYVPVQLAIGEGPATWQAYFNQQMRWAFGCMDILRRHTRPLTRTMRRRNRLSYLALQQHYFAGVAMGLGLILLAGYFYLGLSPARMAPLQVALWFTPLFLARTVIARWLQRFNTASNERGWLWTGRWISTITWPIYLLAAIGVLRGKRLSFKVTPKGDQQDVERTPMAVTAPHAIVGGLSLSFLGCALLFGRTSVPLMGWALANIVLMLGFVGYVAYGNHRAPQLTDLGQPQAQPVPAPGRPVPGLALEA